MKEVSFRTADEVSLRGILLEAAKPKGITLIHGATGVPSSYYKSFAEWLCETKSHHVLIYDYRDNDLKSAKALRQSKTNMADWGLKDQAATLDYGLGEFPNLPLHTIGHSLGGFCTPYHENNNRIVSHTAVNSGLAYWQAHPLYFMAHVILFWFILGPMLTKVLGYLPGQLLGMKTHLPAGVFWQWRRWCINPEFYKVEWGKTLPTPDLDRFKGNLKLVSCEDDNMIPPSCVKRLKQFFPSAKESSFKVLKPEHYGLKKIGHITIFSKKNSKVWPDIIG